LVIFSSNQLSHLVSSLVTPLFHSLLKTVVSVTPKAFPTPLAITSPRPQSVPKVPERNVVPAVPNAFPTPLANVSYHS
jgi:hypothetical protein